MIDILIASQVVSWIVIMGLCVALVALARQVGVLHMRLAPAGALMTGHGPAVGDAAPVLEIATIDGVPTSPSAGRWPRATCSLLLFVSAALPAVQGAGLPIAKSFAKRERLDIVFVGDDDLEEQRQMIARMDIAGLPFVNGAMVGRTFHVDRLPHAVLVGEDGTVLSKVLVNSREHLESLVTAHEMGVVSVQDYLKGHKSKSKVA